MSRRGGRLALWLFGTAAAVYLVDRVTKLWAESTLAERGPIQIISGVLHLTYTTNSGGAFGFGRSAPWLFAGATIAVSIAIVLASTRLPNRGVALSLGAILGGALGNLTDRAANGPGLSGHVTDFIDFRVWPVFNVADTAIVLGAIALAIVTSRRDEGNAASPEPPAAAA